ncbi:hypothetical protein MHU86_8387 [Fragilaria crotonensis]|nr:hypothetical protein MHU86_8387 [Fragilaria crotonensis]
METLQKSKSTASLKSPRMSVVNQHARRGNMFHRQDDTESVEVILLKEPSSPTSTTGLVLMEDPMRPSKGSYHLVTISSSEDTEDVEDELVGLQFLPEDK